MWPFQNKKELKKSFNKIKNSITPPPPLLLGGGKNAGACPEEEVFVETWGAFLGGGVVVNFLGAGFGCAWAIGLLNLPSTSLNILFTPI